MAKKNIVKEPVKEVEAHKAVQEKDLDVKNEEPKEEVKGITIQHLGRIREFTVLKSKVIKVYKGTYVINHPRFKENLVLNPGSVVEVVPELAEFLLGTKDFQKYGVDASK